MAFTIVALEVAAGRAQACLPRVEGWLADTALTGKLRACLFAEIGELDRILLIHDYKEHGWGPDRAKMLGTDNPFGIGDWLHDFHLEAYSSLPGTAIMEGGRHGPFYEVREYALTAEALAPTTQGWATALPDRTRLSPLFLAAYSRITMHRLVSIWPYASLDERMAVQRKATTELIWPPAGTTGLIQDMKSEIFLPAPFSPAL